MLAHERSTATMAQLLIAPLPESRAGPTLRAHQAVEGSVLRRGLALQLLERRADLSFPKAEVAQGGENTLTRASSARGCTLWPYSVPSAWRTRSAPLSLLSIVIWPRWAA